MIVPTKFDPEIFFGQQLIPLAKLVLIKVGLSPATYSPEELINDAFLSVKLQDLEVDETRWARYWYSILRYTALRQLPNPSARRKVDASGGEETGLSLLERLSDDAGKSPEQIWAAIEEANEFEKWSAAVDRNLPRILKEEIRRISPDPYFEKFVRLVISGWSREKPAYTRAYREVLEEAAGKGEKPARARAQFIRYFEELIVAIRKRWDSLNLPKPANLPQNVNLENVSPYYLRWILTEKNKEENNEENEEEMAISTEQVKRKDA